MPYAPGISYHGDQYIFQGLTNAAQSFADALKKKEEQDKQLAFNDAIVHHALDSGRITLDDFNKYRDMSGTKKIGFANGLAANIADEFTRAQAAQKQAMEQAHLGIAQQRLGLEQAAQNFTPPAEAFAGARAAGGELLPTSPGHFTFAEYPNAPKSGTELPEAGTPVRDAEGNQIGTWDAKGKISPLKKPTATDPVKEEMAKILAGTGAPAKPQARMSDKLGNFLRTGPLGPATPVTINSQEELGQLPTGSVFYVADDPEHKLRKKP